jgi:hypothetical protein
MVCQWFGLKTTGTVFSDLVSKPVVTVFSGLASKPVVTVSSGLVSKPVARVSRFGPQNRQLWFGDFGLKITVTDFWFGPQNQAGCGLSVAPQNRREGDGMGYASRSSSLLRIEASRARVSQSSHKIGRGVMVGSARGTIAKVASRSS